VEVGESGNIAIMMMKQVVHYFTLANTKGVNWIEKAIIKVPNRPRLLGFLPSAHHKLGNDRFDQDFVNLEGYTPFKELINTPL